MQKLAESKKYIGEIQFYLNEEDNEEFANILRDSALVLGVLRLLGEAAYAANLMIDNFDGVGNPRVTLKVALKELEIHNNTVIRKSGESIFNAPIYANVKDIAASYRELLQ